VETPYNVTGLQSLFGYGAGPQVDFDLWRQFTIEHLIGAGQGGYPRRIREAVDSKFSHLPENERRMLAVRIHEANVVTACQFCNSTTSRDVAAFTMEEVIADLPPDADEAVAVAAEKLQTVLDRKRQRVQWKLRAVYRRLMSRRL
jgi:hypothetical protein